MSQAEILTLVVWGTLPCLVGFVFGQFFYQWRKLNSAGIEIRIPELLMMRLVKMDRADIFEAAKRLQRECGEGAKLRDIQAHCFAGGRPADLIETYLYLKSMRVDDAWLKAAAMDLIAKHLTSPRPAIDLARERLDSLKRKQGPGI